MKTLLSIGCTIIALVTLAVTNDVSTTQKAKRSKLDRAKVAENFNRRTGGLISYPGAKRGKIVFVNAQSKAPMEWVNDIAAFHAKELKVDIEVANGTFQFPNPKIEGNATLFIIDDAKMPTILHAPEQRWTMVNVATMTDGNGSKPAFFAARVKKELTRSFCLLAGTQTSNYPESLLGCVTKPSDLDKFADWELPVDIPERFIPYLSGFGIKPDVLVTYKQACQEGWAPAPTNDYQRAVWEKIHAIPDKPITIEYDPKFDK